LNKSVPAHRDKLYQLYQEASVFVLPSKCEPFGIAPLEAMLFEVPCIVTDAWAMREFVTPGINGALVEKGSVDSLVAALLGLLRATEELVQMGKGGREMMLKNYAWPTVVGKMRIAASSALSSF
jgi:glycosyltransferase involved in cell wall biosynthesis